MVCKVVLPSGRAVYLQHPFLTMVIETRWLCLDAHRVMQSNALKEEEEADTCKAYIAMRGYSMWATK